MAFKMNKPDMSISYTKHSKGASPLNKVSAKAKLVKGPEDTAKKASPPSPPSPQQDKQNMLLMLFLLLYKVQRNYHL